MKWQLKPQPPQKESKLGVVRPSVLANGEIPVLVSATGRYTEFVSEFGETSREARHVAVSLAEAISYSHQGGSDCWVNHVNIWAVGPLERGRRKILPVVSCQKCQPARTQTEIQALIDSLTPKIAEALDLCERIGEVYADAARRTEIIRQVEAQCATREGYEAACETAEVEALPDEEISQSYGIAYGQFSFPEYSPEVIIKMALAHRRMLALKEEAEAAEAVIAPQASVAVPAKSGQLWEPCRCGKEPVYMPLHLCDACWPKKES